MLIAISNIISDFFGSVPTYHDSSPGLPVALSVTDFDVFFPIAAPVHLLRFFSATLLR